VVHGETRMEAIEKMKQAISNFKIEGVATTLPFGTFVMDHSAFRSGKFDTGFVSKYFTKEEITAMNVEKEEAITKMALYAWFSQNDTIQMPAQPASRWKNRAQ
ncbi:MAG: biotin carboxylase, partial [Chitinophagaceae bacterium]